MKQLYIILLITVFSCDDKTETSSIQEIYYREYKNGFPSKISGLDTIYYHTEVFAFYSDTLGLRMLDRRGEAEINEIINQIPKEYIEPDVFSNSSVLFSKLSRKFYDYNNAIIRRVNPVSALSEPAIKTYYDPSVKKLFTRSYQVSCGDTVYTSELGADKQWIVTYSSVHNDSITSNWAYPSARRASKLITPLTPQTPIPYDNLLKSFVTYTTTTFDTTGRHEFDSNRFAVMFRTFNQIDEAEYSHYVLVVDDSIYFGLKLKAKDSLNHKKKRRLQSQELQKIHRLYNDNKLSTVVPYLIPIPILPYRATVVLVVVKDKSEHIGGGFLDPVTPPYCLSRLKPLDEVYSDCRHFSSTLKGDFEPLYKFLESKYTELDSLQRLIGLK